jgi:RNA polymerase sigma-70 factor
MTRPIDDERVTALYRRGRADRWSVPQAAFARFVETSVARAFPDGTPDPSRLARYLDSLHAEDLALACACAEGIEAAWDQFVLEYRPVLYRAADAIDRSGGAREAADSLYAELFGLGVRDGERQSHFRYFHGRSSLATWLRAVLAQRHVDRMRSVARVDPLPDDDSRHALASASSPDDTPRMRYVAILQRVLAAVVAALVPRDRLRLHWYYAQDLTLAQIGKLLGEHEATVSRNLARTRRTVREQVEAALRAESMPEDAIAECFVAALEDPGPMDLLEVLGPAEDARSGRGVVQSQERL